MKYFGGCDVGSTYTKAVILDENGKMVADTTIKSKINSEQSAILAMDEVCKKAGLKKDEIGKIDVQDRFAYAAVARQKLQTVLKQTSGEKIKGVKTIVEEVK